MKGRSISSISLKGRKQIDFKELRSEVTEPETPSYGESSGDLSDDLEVLDRIQPSESNSDRFLCLIIVACDIQFVFSL